MLKISINLVFMFLISACSTQSKVSQAEERAPSLQHQQNTLRFLDLDQMTDLVALKMDRYFKLAETSSLESAIQIIYSRPNNDLSLKSLAEKTRNQLNKDEDWQNAMTAVLDRAIGSLKTETEPVADQVTYLVLLNNVVQDFGPAIKAKNVSLDFEKEVLNNIASAQIVISENIQKELRLTQMAKIASPSPLASQFLK